MAARYDLGNMPQHIKPSHNGVALMVLEPGIDTELLARLYDEVLVGSLASDELGDPWWTDEVDERATRTRTLIAMDTDGAVVGSLVGEWWHRSRVLLIAYLAVRQDCRGKGIGSALMRVADSELYHWREPLLVLGEVDDARHAPLGVQDPGARVRFYDRFGVCALTLPYFQPPVRQGAPPAYYMLLSSFCGNAPGVRDGVVDGAIVRSFIDEYVGDAKNESEAYAADARWLMSFYNAEQIPLVPLKDYERVPDPVPPSLLRTSRS